MMKKQIENTYQLSLLSLVFFCLFFSSFITNSFAQNKWLNFTNSKEVRDIVFLDNYAWIATSGGLMKMDLKTNEKYLFNRSNSDIPSNNISRVCIDSSNHLWVGTYDGGVALFDGVEWKCFSEDFDGLNSNKILSFY
jgi:ligand-binding sensor domain-containing protein